MLQLNNTTVLIDDNDVSIFNVSQIDLVALVVNGLALNLRIHLIDNNHFSLAFNVNKMTLFTESISTSEFWEIYDVCPFEFDEGSEIPSKN
uniref:hypothetical protein n=1 Tax=Fulvivirga sp. TaxID=1931237 RepID=UPI00404AC53F